MKPMLAEDYVESKLVFPLVAEPKIDGVRALNLTGKLTGRSLKPFGNRYVTNRFSYSAFVGLDGEMAAAHECDPALCRLTTSALSTHEGEPFVLWWLFDYVTVDTCRLPYYERYQLLANRIADLKAMPHLHPMSGQLRLVEYVLVKSLEELNELDAKWLGMGYEGTIVRNPVNGYKYGRSTVREGGLLRIKRFIHFEFKPFKIIEGESNQNEATINELGQTERSTHQENMIPNGMVGAMLGHVVGVVKHEGKVLFEDKQEVRVGAGCLTHDQRRYYFEHQDEFFSQISKAQFFPKGIKDKPRFPTWQSFRMKEDT